MAHPRLQVLIANEAIARNEILPMLISLLECGEEREKSLGEPMIIKETMRLFREMKEYIIGVEELVNILNHGQRWPTHH